MANRSILLERAASGYLAPYDAASAEYLAGWKSGKVLEANVRFMRSPEHHKFTMALIHKLWQAGVFEANSMDAAIDIAKHAAVFVEPIKKIDGSWDVRPRSISYTKADEQTYRQEFAEPLRIEARKLLDMDDPNVRNEFDGLL